MSNKNVLIISPYFPPSNSADMQRVRMSLPYFKDFNWEPEVVYVSQKHSDTNKDELLRETVPGDITLHEVEAFSKKTTSKLGLGSIALRSLWFYKKKVDQLLKQKKFDLIYFSTTQFPVCILGAHWKKKFGVPYVIDMQDPWHSDYYMSKPKHERPPKYWFSYRLNKFLEPIAMRSADGVISVSTAYITTLHERYPCLREKPSATITFGAFEKDFEIAGKYQASLKPAFEKQDGELLIAYVGRGGKDMRPAVSLLFEAFQQGLTRNYELFHRFKFLFVGTSYAAAGSGIPTISPIAENFGISKYVTEQTDRISFFNTLTTLKYADGLFIPGSDDPQYTASKIYPYIMARRPLISLFHPASSAAAIIRDCGSGLGLTFDMPKHEIIKKIIEYLTDIGTGRIKETVPVPEVFDRYTARNMTRLQVEMFEKILGV